MADGEGFSQREEALAQAQRARLAGDLGTAFGLLQRTLDAAEVEGASPADVAPLQLELGAIAAEFGDLGEARRWLEAAEVGYGDDPLGSAAANFALGCLDASSGALGDARRRLRLALKAYDTAGSELESARCPLELADLYVDSGDSVVARLELRAAAPLHRGERVEHRVDLHVVAARAAVGRGEEATAAAELDAALQLAEGLPVRRSQVQSIVDAWNADRSAMPTRRPAGATLDGSSVRFVTIVVGADGMIGEAAIVGTEDVDAGNLGAVRRFVHDVGRDRRGTPVSTEPKVSVALHPDQDDADVPADVARTCHDRHLELSAAFISMIQEDGDPARRLRRLTTPRG